MRYIKIYEDFDSTKDPLIELVKRLDNLVDYNYINDEINITIKSKEDKSKSCPDFLDFLVKYNIEEDSFIIKNISTNEEIGEYYLIEAIPVINYAYRNY